MQWHVGEGGTYEVWRWFGAPGEDMPDSVLQFATDASCFGGGGMFDDDWLTRRWTSSELRHHINALEADMILHVLMVWGMHMAGCRVISWCDNMVSVRAINKGVGCSDMITGIVRRIRLRCLELGISLWVCHIPGAINLTPDALSRGVLAKRMHDWSLIVQCMQKWERRFGPFSLDAFADPSGFNARALEFCSSMDPASLSRVRGHQVWAFPSPVMAEKFVSEVASWEGCQITAVLPSAWAQKLDTSVWECVQTYLHDSQTCRRFDGSHWVRCTNVGMDLWVVHRA